MPNPHHPEPKTRVTLRTAWRETRELMWRFRRQLALGLGLMLVNRLAGLVLPFSSKYLIDQVLGQRRTGLLGVIALAVAAATLLQAATTFALSQVMSVAAQRAITEMRRRVQAHVIRLPITFFDSTKSGVLIARIMKDPEGIRNLVGTGLVQLAGGLLTAVIALGVLFWLNWRLTLATLIVLLAFAGVMAYGFTRLRPIFRERSIIDADVTGRLTESLGGVRVIKTYVAERREDLVFTRGIHRLLRNIARTITGVSAITAFTNVVVGAIGVLIIVAGGRAILGGTMTLGDLVMYIFFIGLMAAPLVQIASIGTQISEAFAGLDRIRELEQMPGEDEAEGRRVSVGALHGEVEFRHVSFEYVTGVPVLRDVSFTAPEGSTTALVGSSGAGKSTLIALIMAFSRPKSGQILVDGHDLDRLRLREYRSNLGVVLQDNFLFDGTIADNIRFANPGASEEVVREAACIAHADEFIERFDEGYDTIVGERGVKLSGGQRQRVAIARAIIADPRILILDEATSSLDSESEAKIRDGLRALRRGRTTFVIAHRLSTIASADQILVMEGGEIVERGTHAELLARRGRYRQLYDRQFLAEQDRFVNPGEELPAEQPGDAVVVGD